jgi:hypothetical protein
MGGGVSTDSLTDDQKGNVMDKIAKVMGEYSLARRVLVKRVLVRRVLVRRVLVRRVLYSEKR